MIRKENIMDVIIKDLDGNYYDINYLYTEGNDMLIIEIKKKNQEYIKPKKPAWKKADDNISNKIREGF